MSQTYCEAPECTELAKRDGLCWTHYRWSREGKPLAGEKNRRKNGMKPLERLTEAAITYSETPSDDDAAWRRALDNLCASAERYVEKLWRERAREAQQRARRAGKHIGRPPKRDGPVSRWTRWRRERFRRVVEGATAE